MQYVDLGVLSHKKKESSKFKKILKWSSLALASAVVFYAAYLLYFPASTLLREIFRHPSSALSLVRNPEGTIKNDNGRTNFLLLGIDKRENVPYSYNVGGGEVQKNGFLSDTLIVVSIDQNTKQTAMVSIPRDTWVKLPSWPGHPSSFTKINAAYSFGESEGYPGGGMELAREVVSRDLGIPIHYVARIDFAGFKKAIDDLGGVDVNVEKSFDDYNYPASDSKGQNCLKVKCVKHVSFKAGMQHMDGEKALEFSRSRRGTNGEGSDFARAKRQQKVLLAARDKALSIYTIFDPLKVNKIFSNFGESIATDIDIAAFPKIYKFAKEMDTSKIKTVVLDNSSESYLYTPPSNQYGGAYVLLPKGNDWSKIQEMVKNVFNETSDQTNNQQRQ